MAVLSSDIAAGGSFDDTTRPGLWIPPALREAWPHLPGFLPEFRLLDAPPPPGSGDLTAGEGAAAFHEAPVDTPAFNGLRRPVALVFPGLPPAAPPPGPEVVAALAPQGPLSPHTRFADPFRARPCSAAEAAAILELWRRTEAENRAIGAFLHMQRWKRAAIATAFGHRDGHAPFAETPAEALGQRRGAVLAWATRLSAETEAEAARRGVPLWRVEDGFLRSIGLGVNFAPAASLAVDPIGMHYDATRPSRLERILAETAFAPELLARARALREEIARRDITKYNLDQAPPPLPATPGRPRLLVVGQVEDDASIRFGAGRIRTNAALLAAVRAAHPDAFIVWKPHPDVETGYRRGYLPPRQALRYADTVLPQGDIRPLFRQVDALHTMTSLAGFEALLRGLPVTTWGRPFYAGWGLTTDMDPPPRRGRRLSLDELVAGALILYPRYQDPVTGLPCTPELLLERLSNPRLWPPLPPGQARWLRWWKLQGRILRALRHWGVWQR
ncbi:MAG: capsule biosynthesis protein [Rhodovarius sp.]|nr:capsule biosynthesis protein [Rhodovarius sp.]MDW8313824.1 capsule biosynthesis protein [Rhodovarius sp.]